METERGAHLGAELAREIVRRAARRADEDGFAAGGSSPRERPRRVHANCRRRRDDEGDQKRLLPGPPHLPLARIDCQDDAAANGSRAIGGSRSAIAKACRAAICARRRRSVSAAYRGSSLCAGTRTTLPCARRNNGAGGTNSALRRSSSAR